MSFWEWVGAIAAGWFTASVLFAIAWRLVGKRIFRPRPVQPKITVEVPRIDAQALTDELRRQQRLNGGWK